MNIYPQVPTAERGHLCSPLIGRRVEWAGVFCATYRCDGVWRRCQGWESPTCASGWSQNRCEANSVHLGALFGLKSNSGESVGKTQHVDSMCAAWVINISKMASGLSWREAWQLRRGIYLENVVFLHGVYSCWVCQQKPSSSHPVAQWNVSDLVKVTRE